MRTTCEVTAGLVAQVTVPFLRSEYGKDYDYEAPVKLLDAMMHAQADSRDQQARCPLGRKAGISAGLCWVWRVR